MAEQTEANTQKLGNKSAEDLRLEMMQDAEQHSSNFLSSWGF